MNGVDISFVAQGLNGREYHGTHAHEIIGRAEKGDALRIDNGIKRTFVNGIDHNFLFPKMV
jgi:hypothetical protein